MDVEKWNAFLKLISDAFELAEKSKICSLDDEDKKRTADKCSALSYAAACTAKYSAAEAIYWTSPEIMQFNLSELFAAFDDFVKEVQSNFDAGDLRQWVPAHFDRLEELYKDFELNQPASN